MLLGSDGGTAPPTHLLTGARAFREGRFAQALVEFQVARAQGATGEVDWYAAATLARLGRGEDAVEAFELAKQTAPEAGDALLGYYEAVACVRAQLLVRADGLLAAVEGKAGDKVAKLARELKAEVARALSGEPPTTAIDELVKRAERATQANRPRLARALLTEALALAARRADRHRGEELGQRLRPVEVSP